MNVSFSLQESGARAASCARAASPGAASGQPPCPALRAATAACPHALARGDAPNLVPIELGEPDVTRVGGPGRDAQRLAAKFVPTPGGQGEQGHAATRGDAPGMIVTLRVRAAGEIGGIEYAGLHWCDFPTVELPLYVAERCRVAEGERHRLGPLPRYREGDAARPQKVAGRIGLPRLGIHPIDPNRRPGDSDNDGSGHRRGVIGAGHRRSGFTIIGRRGQCGGERQEQGQSQGDQK